MDIFDVIYNCRAMRRLDTKPVPAELLVKLIDAANIIIHIFHPEKRKFYDLERMWSELIPKERLTI